MARVATCRCGSPFTAVNANQQWCSDACRNRHRVRGAGTCRHCGIEFTHGQSRTQTFCSATCRGLAYSLATKNHTDLKWVACDQCGSWFVANRSPGTKRCSIECRAQHSAASALARYYRLKAEQADGRTPKSFRRNVDRRARRLADGWVEDVPVDYLIERDASRCHICHLAVDPTVAWPDPQSPSIDHLVPLSAGGEHSRANTALAHLGCNSRKHVKSLGEQLRLVG